MPTPLELEPTTTAHSPTTEPIPEPSSEPSHVPEEISGPALDEDDELPPAPDPDEPASTPTPPEGVTVDEKGRWRTADGKFASQQPTPEATASVQAEQAAEAPPAESPKPVTSPVVPWKANIYGQEVEFIPGAKFHPEAGVLIPPDQIGRLQMALARSTKYPEVQTARQEAARIRESAKAETDSLMSIIEQTALNDEWVMRRVSDPAGAERELRMLAREAQIALKEKYGTLPTVPPPEPKTEHPDPGELDPYDAELGLEQWLEKEVWTIPEYHGLFSDTDKRAIRQKLLTVQPFAKHKGKWAIDQLIAGQLIEAYAEAPRREQALKAAHEQERVASLATKRNVAAVPTSTKPAAPKPTVAQDRKADPQDFSDQPWNDPSLPRHERRRLYNQKVLGLSD